MTYYFVKVEATITSLARMYYENRMNKGEKFGRILARVYRYIYIIMYIHIRIYIHQHKVRRDRRVGKS